MPQTEWDALLAFVAREVVEGVMNTDPSIRVDDSECIVDRALARVKGIEGALTRLLRTYLSEGLPR